jgi:phosphoenolpyruvate carboxykinase (GTP)
MRVLEWILKRVSGEVAGQQTAIGVLPAAGELNTDGLNLSAEALQALLTVDNAGWQQETQEIAEYLKTYGERTPQALFNELDKTQQQLS